MRKIANIVFYKFYENGQEIRRAHIFYTDGTSEDVSYEEGIDACEEIVKTRHITSKEEFKELINNELIHVTTRMRLEKDFEKYIDDSDFWKEDKDDYIDDANFYQEDKDDYIERNHNSNDSAGTEEDTKEDIEDIEEDNNSNDSAGTEEDTKEDIEDIEEDKNSNDSTDIEEDIEDIEEESEKEGLFKRIWNKIKSNKIVSSIIFCVVAIATAFGITTATKNLKDKSGENPKVKQESSTENSSNNNTNKGKSASSQKSPIIAGDNCLYDDYSYSDLLKVTDSKSQKKAMKSIGSTIKNFNGKFADAHLENGKNVRAALSFDELVALQQTYNNYSSKQIKAYFNGTEINASEMTQDYKSASLQLMGAHVIETRENPVDMSNLLKTEEAKMFYEKYHEMFLTIKEANENDKLSKIKNFYQEVKKDFPITNEVRTEGIMHAEDYDKIDSYKLSVTPMIAAAEMMYQNLETDQTLNDDEIDFLNDIGLCNYAQDKFEKIETITLNAEEDNTNPLYEQYRNSIISMMKEKNQYVTTDEQRELSKLDAFQSAVNWHSKNDSAAPDSTAKAATTESHNETKTWTTTNTTYRTEQTTEEKDIPVSEKEKVDKEIEKENEKSKKEGKKKAKEKQKKMQQEADKEADKVKKEVEEDKKDLDDRIEDANNQIDNNNQDNDTSNDKPVNENDFGDHDVDFDDNHSNENGDLDNSVEDITTDSTGDKTNEELPDPNKTGAEFDQITESESKTEETFKPTTTTSAGQTIYEYEEEAPKMSNEDIVNQYVEDLANSSNSEESDYTYTK